MHRAATIGLARAAVAKHPERPELRLLLAQALAASGEAAVGDGYGDGLVVAFEAAVESDNEADDLFVAQFSVA